MNVFRTLRTRKFLQRILLSFMLVVVTLAVTAYLLNVNARGKVLSLQNDADRKLLTQINYNIENMNGIVKDMAVSLFNDDELIALKAGGRLPAEHPEDRPARPHGRRVALFACRGVLQPEPEALFLFA
ncbi:hypothetical protein [Cohnella rhizosphaerae]|uniref:Uncharacterized protein n=1 Tax=Cohnella rhizosphaerae TaxID=1457232 RepID=A0A9X4KU03_9BACL|nr:hypothetical protein [Cohnella rhizosphaerae]MDG0810770.1 hypothetical protein [Cohnella rhizosphaerae]